MKRGSTVLRKILSLTLSTALAASMLLAVPAQSFADVSAEDTDVVRGLANMYGSYPGDSYYSDEFFKGDSYDYNTDLAAASVSICYTALYLFFGKDYENQTNNLKQYLEDNGFTDFEYNDDYTTAPALDTTAVACAHKQIEDNGKTYTLLAVIPRSGTYGEEFAKSIMVNKTAYDKRDHAGYDERKDDVIEFVQKYMKEHVIKGDMKVWTTGYSGGAGICSLFAAALIRTPKTILGSRANLDPSDLYCYTFCPMNAAARESISSTEYDYGCIHNVNDEADILAYIPTSDCFGRYGRTFHYKDYAARDEMLNILKAESEAKYEAFISTNDWEKYFKPYKLNKEALLSDGTLEMIVDDNSYLRNDEGENINQAEFFAATFENLADALAREGDGSSRKGYYKNYQEPMMRWMALMFGNNLANMKYMYKLLTGSEKSTYLMLSMYAAFITDKALNENSTDAHTLIEEAFNILADIDEDNEGNLKDIYSKYKAYLEIKKNFFEKTDSGRYELVQQLVDSSGSVVLELLKKLTADIYADCLNETLEDSEIDEELVTLMTSEDDSKACSWIIAQVLFGDSLQSSEIDLLNPENEQFKHLATFNSNMTTTLAPHMDTSVLAWIRAGSQYYSDYSHPDAAGMTGYRRVYIDYGSGASVTGTVKNEVGKVCATFKDGKILSRTDEWIGYTTSDDGGWLRLPLAGSYKVCLTSSGSTSLGLSVGDYSQTDNSDVRTISKDASSDWSDLSINSGDSLTLNIPAAPETDGVYDLTGAEYTLDISRAESSSGESAEKADAVCSASVPAVKSVSVKGSRKAFTVKWKKLSAKQRRKFSRIEVQYSTNKSFSSGSVVTKTVGKGKKMLKIKKLAKGTKYYVRVRNVKYSGGIKYVSKWSAVKKVKTR